jgi:hypothetical protein
MSFISDCGPEVARPKLDATDSAMPGMDTADLIVAEFKKSAALLTVSTQQTLIVARSNFKFVGFSRLIGRLIAVDETDKRERILLWILDLGGLNILDLDSRVRFENVDELVRRFKVLRSFEDRRVQARWDWLKSRAVIVLRNPISSGDDVAIPDFTAGHVLLDTIPAAWERSAKLRALYGRDLERRNEANYSIFVNESADRAADEGSSDQDGRHAFGYYGHAKFAHGRRDQHRLRGLKLPSPGEEYEIAFRTVYAAAADFLGLRRAAVDPSIDGKKAAQELRSLGFSLLHLDEFMKLDPRA